MHIIAIILIVAGQLIDYLSTREAIARGAKEANPFVKLVGLGTSKVLAAAILSALLLLVPAVWALLTSTVILAFCIIVSIYNVTQGKNARTNY